MTDAADMPEQEAQGETKPGPANPHPEGVEAPTPPGSALRQDATGPGAGSGSHDGGHDGEHDDSASANPAANRSAEEAGGGTLDLEDEPGPEGHQPPGTGAGDDGRDVQEENAETSLDQPSQ